MLGRNNNHGKFESFFCQTIPSTTPGCLFIGLLMGTERKTRRADEGHRRHGLRDRRPRPRHEMGGCEGVSRLWRRRQALRLRRDTHAAGRAVGGEVPDSGSRADPRPRVQRRGRRHRRHLVPGQDRARSHADRVAHSSRARLGHHGGHAPGAACRPRPTGQRTGQTGRC